MAAESSQGTLAPHALENDRKFWVLYEARKSRRATRPRCAHRIARTHASPSPACAQKGETIGRGHFAKVKLVRQRSTGEFYAAKILDKQLDEHQEDYASMMREFGTVYVHSKI